MHLIQTLSIACLCFMPTTYTPPLRELPALVTYYDPALGGINCGGGGCAHTADGTAWTPEDSGSIAACPQRMLGAHITLHGIAEGVRCADRGSRIRVEWSRWFDRYVLRVDVLWSGRGAPPWNYALVGWSYD